MYNYIIVAGSTKCATTSLYNYLANHPKICPSLYKETRFFLNSNYPLERRKPGTGDTILYNDFFKDCSNDLIKLEATPDYLYSEFTEQNIKEALQNCLIVLILRNPTERLLSWYNFSIQMNLLSGDISFKDYFHTMLNGNAEKKQHLMALEQGNYCPYLKKYIDCFGKNNINVILYEDFISNPLNSIKTICGKLNIDSNFYEKYNFNIHNQTLNVKNQNIHNRFTMTRRLARKILNLSPVLLRDTVKKFGKLIVTKYLKLNTSKKEVVELDSETKKLLRDYYFQSNEQIDKLTGLKTDWNNS